MMGLMESTIKNILDREEKDLRYRLKADMRKAAIDAVIRYSDVETICSRISDLPEYLATEKPLTWRDR